MKSSLKSAFDGLSQKAGSPACCDAACLSLEAGLLHRNAERAWLASFEIPMNQPQHPVVTPILGSQIAVGRTWLWQGAFLLLLLGFVYRDILALLVWQWSNDPDFSHGFFVPLFVAFVIWQRRKQLAAVRVAPSWWGLVIIAGALMTLLVGVLGAELFLSRSSLVLLLSGLVIYFLGWRFFRVLLFPWAVLFLMIPIPKVIFNQITFPLQFLASRLATGLLSLAGVPVLREGNIIQLPAMTLEVVEACSGIRSLLSLGTLAVIYAYFLEPSISRRVVLLAAAVPIAVAANALRITGTGLLGQYWSPDKSEGFFHAFSGWVIFVLSVLMLFCVHSLLGLLKRWGSAGKD